MVPGDYFTREDRGQLLIGPLAESYDESPDMSFTLARDLHVTFLVCDHSLAALTANLWCRRDCCPLCSFFSNLLV